MNFGRVQDPRDPQKWGWGWSSLKTVMGGGLQCPIKALGPPKGALGTPLKPLGSLWGGAAPQKGPVDPITIRGGCRTPLGTGAPPPPSKPWDRRGGGLGMAWTLQGAFGAAAAPREPLGPPNKPLGPPEPRVVFFSSRAGTRTRGLRRGKGWGGRCGDCACVRDPAGGSDVSGTRGGEAAAAAMAEEGKGGGYSGERGGGTGGLGGHRGDTGGRRGEPSGQRRALAGAGSEPGG